MHKNILLKRIQETLENLDKINFEYTKALLIKDTIRRLVNRANCSKGYLECLTHTRGELLKVVTPKLYNDLKRLATSLRVINSIAETNLEVYHISIEEKREELTIRHI